MTTTIQAAASRRALASKLLASKDIRFDWAHSIDTLRFEIKGETHTLIYNKLSGELIIDGDGRGIWSPEYQFVIENKLDAVLIANLDPVMISIPIFPTKNVWENVLLSLGTGEGSPKDRASTNLRHIWLRTYDVHGYVYAGVVQFPFSIVDLRSLAINTFESEHDNEDYFVQVCPCPRHNPLFAGKLSLEDKWKIAYNSPCGACERIGDRLAEAIPKIGNS